MREKLSFNTFILGENQVHYAHVWKEVVLITYSFLKYLEMLIFLIFYLVVHLA